MNSKVSPLALTLIVLGILLLLKLAGEVTVPYTDIYGNMLLFYGIVSVFMNMGKQNKGGLFVGVLSFMIGVLLYVLNHLDIMSTNRMVLPAFFYILASSFLFLYFDDFSEKIFLFISLFLILAGYLSSVYYDSSELIRFSAENSKIILSQWEYLFIIIGLGVIADRRG
ncbi:hypothetical protein MNBD_IGNAVI01-1724 [hydrothermal vent metagenome]|uniref:Uncharacterized protein n=1 Tax=hydrothermal vent metagenome TaxID=652676 RepID=A0A3B1C8Y4_9ZZZZ